MNAHTNPSCSGAPTIYAVYNRTCGHVAAVPNDRGLAERFVSNMVLRGQFQWRVRVAAEADIQAVVVGERCEDCTQDGQVTA